MANELKPKDQARSIIQTMERALNETTLGGISIEAKIVAKRTVSILIEEHNYNAPISWNTTRKKYWESVLKEVDEFKID